MGMIEADDVLAAAAAFALDSHQFLGIDVVAVVRGIRSGVAAAGSRGYDAGAVVVEAPKQNATAFVRIGFFAVKADRIVVFGIDL